MSDRMAILEKFPEKIEVPGIPDKEVVIVLKGFYFIHQVLIETEEGILKTEGHQGNAVFPEKVTPV